METFVVENDQQSIEPLAGGKHLELVRSCFKDLDGQQWPCRCRQIKEVSWRCSLSRARGHQGGPSAPTPL